MKSIATSVCITGFLCLTFVGCGQKVAPANTEDARLTQQIVGTWTLTVTSDIQHSNGFKATFKATNYFTADGNYSFVGDLVQSNVNKTFNYDGTWLVTNRDLVFTLTKSSEPKVQPVGMVIRAHIIQLDAGRMVYNLDGQTIALDRVK
jgi:hypothetical protein